MDGRRRLDWLLALCAAGFVAAAVYHAVGVVRPAWLEPAPIWRHALFVGLNLALAAGFLVRPRFLVWVFPLFVAEQLYGHAVRAWTIWTAEHRVDWTGLVPMVFTPIMLALLVLDARARRTENLDLARDRGMS